MDEEAEKICVQRFLNWYSKQHKRNYIHHRAEDYFPELKGGLRWEFVAYERDNPEEWIGIEVKELSTTREVHIWFEFWEDLCLELTQDLAVKGVQGKFKIIHPPVFNLKSKERPKFREAFIEVLANKESILKVDFTDIGPDIADKSTNWPKQKSRNRDEYRKWGGDRPAELLINKSPYSGCQVISSSSPIVARDGVEIHEKTFNEADIKHANKQLKLAKEKGARKTILLFACEPFIYEDLIKNQVQNLDRHYISDIDYIYLVDMGDEGRVVKVYPISGK
jgi:hypothetical protein